VAIAAAVAGCAHRAPPDRPAIGAAEPGERPRLLVLPVDNLAASIAPVKELSGAISQRMRERFEVVAGHELERFLAAHRLRHTGGIDSATARAAREELRADAVLITSLELYRAAPPPMLGLTMRLVSTADEPIILWMDSFAHSGDEAPGLLGLGMESRIERIRDRVLRQLAGSLHDFLDGTGADERLCDASRRHRPKIRFRSEALDHEEDRIVAVVPFLDLTKRRGAGEAVSLEFVRQLVASGRYRVLEPGVVRDYLLRARVIMPGGVSLETTRLMLGTLGAPYVLSGVVLDFDESPGPRGPTIRFGATMLDGGSGEILWSSRSSNAGDDGVFLFGMGRVRTAPELTCRMVASTIEELGRAEATRVAWPHDREDHDSRRFTRIAPQRRSRSAPRDVAETPPPAEAPRAGKDPDQG
jgi:hypothetical protein